MITLEPPRGTVDEAQAWVELGLSRSGLSRYLRVAQDAVGLAGEVDVLLAGDRTVRRLNREFRGKDKATDVLSFPPAVELSGVHAGDLAVSVETAARQAREQGHALRDEVRVLLLHGLLHLAGMDHEVDGGEMAAREAELRSRLRLKRGLIARVEGVLPGRVKQIYLGNDSKKGKRKSKGAGIASATSGRRAETRIPFGIDNQEGDSRSKGKEPRARTVAR